MTIGEYILGYARLRNIVPPSQDIFKFDMKVSVWASFLYRVQSEKHNVAFGPFGC